MKKACAIAAAALCFALAGGALAGCSRQTGKTGSASSARLLSASGSSADSAASASAADSSSSGGASSSPAASSAPAPSSAAPASSAPSSAVSTAPAKVYVNVTVPPGYCAIQIGQLLQSKGICSQADFLAQVNAYPFTESSMSQISYDPKTVCYRLEGFLYPDTYQFYQGMKAQDAIGILLRGADSHIGGKYSYDGMTTYQLVTLASVIEKEAPDLATMEKVSAVFHNRLNAANSLPYLQSEATRRYLTNYLNSVSPALVEQYKIYYNTNPVDGQARRKGLPAGPICNPGANALYAAAHPDQDDYLYFSSDGAGHYTFSHDYLPVPSESGA